MSSDFNRCLKGLSVVQYLNANRNSLTTVDAKDTLDNKMNVMIESIDQILSNKLPSFFNEDEKE
jgi:hypothetical protein